MALTTLNYVLTSMNMLSASLPQQQRIDQLRAAIEEAVKNYCKWELEETADQIDYYDGNGQTELPLRRPWVSEVSEVKMDATGAYGQKAGSFGSSTELTAGTNYAFKLDGNIGATDYGKSGLLIYLGGNVLWMPSDYFGGPWGRGGLSYAQPPRWPVGYGILKVTYTYGFATIPADIQLAVATGCAIVNNSSQYGFPVQSEGLARYNYNLAISQDAAFGTVRQLLGRYRDTSI